MRLTQLLGLACFVVSSLFFTSIASATTTSPTPTATNTPSPTPTLPFPCQQKATITVDVSLTTVVVGDTVTVNLSANNNGGCYYAPFYSSTVSEHGGTGMFTPSSQTAPGPSGDNLRTFIFTAASAGTISFNASVFGEYSDDYTPTSHWSWAYIGGTSVPVTVVTPTPTATSTSTPTVTNTPTGSTAHVILDFESTGTEQCGANTTKLTPKTDFQMYLYVENESLINVYDKEGNLIATLDVQSNKISKNKASFNAFTGNTTNNASLSGMITYDKAGNIQSLDGTFIRRGIINSCYASGKFVAKYFGVF